METQPKIAFFGTPDIAVWVLEELKAADIIPTLIVTNPDRKQGRGLTLLPTPVKIWAHDHDIEVFSPETLLQKEALGTITSFPWDLFVVVAYGLIMPKWFIDLPKHGTINLHPSLLPKLRGASPIRTSILNNFKDTGVTIMLMDEKMDHGPILAQEACPIKVPIRGTELDKLLSQQGGKLLAKTIPRYLNGEIEPQPQDHTQATYSKKITKDMAELELDPFDLPKGQQALQTLLRIYAFDGNPGTFFYSNGKRIKISDATIEDDTLKLLRVIPEGKKEIDFEQLLKNLS